MFATPLKDKVIIMGKLIPIVIDDNKLELISAAGLYEAEVIYLQSEYETIREFKRIYSHECFHALCDILGIQLEHHTEEILAHRVSTMFAYEL